MIELFISIANTVGIAPTLLMGICWTESNFNNVINHYDGNSPSYGVCQIKLSTAKEIIPNITKKEIMKPEINIYITAKLLKKYSIKYKYQDSWISKYNGGLNKGINNWGYVNKVKNNMKHKPWNKLCANKK